MKKLSLFLSSPGDVDSERQKVHAVVKQVNLLLGKQLDSEYFGLLGGYYLLIIPIIFAGLLAFSLPANEEKWAQAE